MHAYALALAHILYVCIHFVSRKLAFGTHAGGRNKSRREVAEGRKDGMEKRSGLTVHVVGAKCADSACSANE